MLKSKGADRLPLSRAVLYIFLSTVLISGSATLGWLYYQQLQTRRAADVDYTIVAIVQTGPVRNALPTQMLAELMHLSADKPANSYRFDADEAVSMIEECPFVAKAEVSVVKPAAVYVDYTLREPIAIVSDYDNVGIDRDGYLFPMEPYIHPDHLPKVALGLPDWGDKIWRLPLEPSLMLLLTEVLDYVRQDPTLGELKLVDVSHAAHESNGSRELVVRLSAGQGSRLLRLCVEEWRNGLSRYHRMREFLGDKQADKTEIVVDLRVPQIALYTTTK